jgi:hypothetical protein
MKMWFNYWGKRLWWIVSGKRYRERREGKKLEFISLPIPDRESNYD